MVSKDTFSCGVALHLKTYFLLSASWGSVPGSVMVIVVGELTSYLLCGFLQTFILTRPVKIVLETADTSGCNLLGKKLKKKVYCQFQT